MARLVPTSTNLKKCTTHATDKATLLTEETLTRKSNTLKVSVFYLCPLNIIFVAKVTHSSVFKRVHWLTGFKAIALKVGCLVCWVAGYRFITLDITPIKTYWTLADTGAWYSANILFATPPRPTPPHTHTQDHTHARALFYSTKYCILNRQFMGI